MRPVAWEKQLTAIRSEPCTGQRKMLGRPVGIAVAAATVTRVRNERPQAGHGRHFRGAWPGVRPTVTALAGRGRGSGGEGTRGGRTHLL